MKSNSTTDLPQHWLHGTPIPFPLPTRKSGNTTAAAWLKVYCLVTEGRKQILPPLLELGDSAPRRCEGAA